jgi:hypothetical protein
MWKGERLFSFLLVIVDSLATTSMFKQVENIEVKY